MSFTYSTQQFSSGEVLDLDGIESLNSEASKRLFRRLPSFRPTLEAALRDAKIQDHDIVLSDSMEFSCDALEDPEISSLGLTPDEAGAITSYTLELGDNSPYKVINRGLAGSRNRDSLSSTRKLIFLLLSGLRKLPRFRPAAGQIYYRGIGSKEKIPQNIQEANGHQYYEKGRTVTWWGFTSTTTDSSQVYEFIKSAPEKTFFNIGGENLWGYDIQKFSQFPKEGEILLEPEARVFVNSVVPYSNPLMVHLTFQPFDHLVLEDIIPVSGVPAAPIDRSQISSMKNVNTTENHEERGNVTSKNKLNLPFNNYSKNVNVSQKSVNSGSLHFKKSVEKKWECVWKECPKKIDKDNKYSVDENNHRIATKISGNDESYSTFIGNTSLPTNRVTSWIIRILKSKWNNGSNICIGVTPFDINQNEGDNYKKCGWYLACFDSTLCSGPPHNYVDKEYGPRKRDGNYVHTEDSVGVVMDTAKGELSFVLNRMNYGVAYEGIPLNKPLVPCVIVLWSGDSVELEYC